MGMFGNSPLPDETIRYGDVTPYERKHIMKRTTCQRCKKHFKEDDNVVIVSRRRNSYRGPEVERTYYCENCNNKYNDEAERWRRIVKEDEYTNKISKRFKK